MNSIHISVESNSSKGSQPESDEPPSWVKPLIAHKKCIEHLESKPFAFTLYLCDADEIQSLNLKYRQKNTPTNVLSFPAELPEFITSLEDGFTLGDVVCCPEVIDAQAQAQGKNIKDHWAHMVIHGVLHLLGFDHIDPQDADIMESIEIFALNELGIGSPYELTEDPDDQTIKHLKPDLENTHGVID